MKHILCTILFLYSFNYSYSQFEMGKSELLIKNRLPVWMGNIKVRIYPVGLFFRSGNRFTNSYFQYTPFAQEDDHPQNNPYITGGEKTLIPYINYPDSIDRRCLFKIDQDGASDADRCDITVGYGKYKIDILYQISDSWDVIKSFTMDWSDSDYPINYSGGLQADIKVYVLNINDVRITYGGGHTEPFENYEYNFHDLSLFNNEIKSWYQYKRYPNGDDTIYSKIPNKSGFVTTDTLNNISLNTWPIIGTNFSNQFPTSLHLNPGTLNVNLEVQNSHYAKINTNHPFIVEDSAKLKLKNSDTYANNARLYVQNFGEFRIKPAGNLELDKYGNIILESGGKMYMEENSNIVFQDHGEIILNSGGTLYNCGADIVNNSSACILVNNGGTYLVGSQYCNPGILQTVDNGAFIVINGGTLSLSDSSKLIFDGSSSFLKITPNSNIKLGENASIEFKNGAYISADGGNFSSSDSSKLWEGIKLVNSDNDTISNCVFRHAKTALKITNNESASYNSRLIKNNYFHVPTGDNYQGILSENNYRIIIENNVFNMPLTGSGYKLGIFLRNFNIGGFGASGSESSLDDPFTVNIVRNTFYNGTTSMIAHNSTSNIIPLYITYNTFNYCTSVNLILIKADGAIKNNVFTFMSTPNAVFMINGNPDFYNNVIASNGVSMRMSGLPYPNLQPVRYQNAYIWTGGKNSISSYTNDNIQIEYGGNVFSDYGRNSFLATNLNAYHFYGKTDTSIHRYFTRDNCWHNTGTPRISLTRIGDLTPMLITYYNSGYDCNTVIDPIEIETNDRGFGIIDSTIVSVDNSGTTQTDEDILFAQAQELYSNGQYNDAIADFKTLINNYPGSFYLETILYDLYASYEGIDTSETQSYKNIIYGNLKVYLEDKIESENYSQSFNDIAFDNVLMCLANMTEYDDAMNGYEFVSLFHPDPDIRLLASWNYAEIEAIMNSGSGGGVSSKTEKNIQTEEKLKELNELKRIMKAVNDNPLMRKMKESYLKKKEFKDDKFKQSHINKNNDNENLQAKIKDEIRNGKETKARRNIFELKNLNDEELEKRRIEDIILITETPDFKNTENTNLKNPDNFQLHQNYPNPFNPSTKISFTIPKGSFVTLKVYDITGREVKTLINEYKQSGSYETEFDASLSARQGNAMSSGVYFYKLEADGISEIKKMILVK